MAKQARKAKRHVPKTVLRLPDLDQAKSVVLNNLSSVDAQRGYRQAIDEFVECTARSLGYGRTGGVAGDPAVPGRGHEFTRDRRGLNGPGVPDAARDGIAAGISSANRQAAFPSCLIT